MHNSLVDKIKVHSTKTDGQNINNTFEEEKNPLIFALYIVPGLIYWFINSQFAIPISKVFQLNLWATQMYIICLTLFIPMLFITYFYLKKVNKFTFTEIISYLGLNRFSWANMGITLLVFIVFFLPFAFIWIPYVSIPVSNYLNSIPFLKIPDWNWQNTLMPSIKTLPPSIFVFPLILLLIFNHVGEEVFFRGLLYRKTEVYSGKWTPIVAGLLFILYHSFQLTKTYPMFPIGIVIAWLYHWKRDIYSVIFFHLLINLAGI